MLGAAHVERLLWQEMKYARESADRDSRTCWAWRQHLLWLAVPESGPVCSSRSILDRLPQWLTAPESLCLPKLAPLILGLLACDIIFGEAQAGSIIGSASPPKRSRQSCTLLLVLVP